MKRKNIIFGILILSIIILGIWEYWWDLTAIEKNIQSHPFLGSAIYVTLLATSVVILPFSSLPFLPFAANTFGIWMAGVLSIAGWWIGCLIAFQIARMGRPLIERFVSLKTVDALEKKIPPDIGFIGIVILRMTFPVDVISFALGLFKHLSFSMYALASLIGIIPFAFVWSYAGGEIRRGEFLVAAIALMMMAIAVYLIRSVTHKRHDDQSKAPTTPVP